MVIMELARRVPVLLVRGLLFAPAGRGSFILEQPNVNCSRHMSYPWTGDASAGHQCCRGGEPDVVCLY